jgi:hypothetical protein
MQRQKSVARRNREWTKANWFRFLFTLAVTFGLIVAISWWRFHTVNWRDVGVMLALVAITALIALFPTFRNELRGIIGERRRPVQLPRYRLFLPMPFAVPFVFYLLLSDTSKSVPAALQFSIIAISPTLGGLVLAGASNRRIKRRAHDELVSVAQKFVVATVAFILCTSLAFFVGLIGDINVNVWDLSLIGFTRGISFWTSAALFYAGAYLFLLALTDLVITLRHLIKG